MRGEVLLGVHAAEKSGTTYWYCTRTDWTQRLHCHCTLSDGAGPAAQHTASLGQQHINNPPAH